MAGAADPLEGVDWEDVLRRLLAEAVLLFRSHGLAGRSSVLSGTGMSPQDLAYQTVTKALGRDGILYQAGRGRLLAFLKEAMRNDFLDLLKAHSHSRTDRKPVTAALSGAPAPTGRTDRNAKRSA